MNEQMNFSQVILAESRRGSLERGGFRTRRFGSSNQLASSQTLTFWEIRTNFSYEKLLRCLQMELFLEGKLETVVFRMLLDAPGVLEDDLFMTLLRVKNEGVDQNVLLQRLQFLQQLIGKPKWTKNLMYTYRGALKYELLEIRTPIRKVKKFSGWVRNSSAVGSKRPSAKPLILNVETSQDLISEDQFDFYEFLSVGRLPGILAGAKLSFPDEN